MQTNKQLSPEQKPETLFNAAQIDILIRQTEDKVTTALTDLNNITPYFREIETAYNIELEKFNAANHTVGTLKELIATLAAYRLRLKDKNGLRVLRTTSHTDKPVKKLVRVGWNKQALKVLERMQTFVLPSDLFDIICNENEIARRAKSSNVHVYSQTMYVFKNNKSFAMFKNRIGLKGWVDAGGMPLLNYIKPFMY